MPNEKPFKKMTRNELKQLIEETADNIEIINSFIKDEFQGCKQAMAEAEINKKLQEINDAYNEICIDDEKGESIKTQLEEAQNLSEEINDFHEKQKEKYTTLYSKIEQELKAGTTSANLSKSFADKVREYFWSGIVWSGLFIAAVVAIVIFSYITISNEGQYIKTVSDAWRFLIFRAPLIAFAVWLVGFLGNRRAESKKLEESYKHKEVIARSFVGYRETIEDLNDSDNKLIEKHMNNLLEAINDNSSKFLNFEGEKYPLLEWLLTRSGKSKKTDSKKDEPENN